MDKQDVFRAIAMTALILLEWYTMQPYQEPVLARLWDMLAAIARRFAEAFGRFALHAENNYYIAVEAGL